MKADPGSRLTTVCPFRVSVADIPEPGTRSIEIFVTPALTFVVWVVPEDVVITTVASDVANTTAQSLSSVCKQDGVTAQQARSKAAMAYKLVRSRLSHRVV